MEFMYIILSASEALHNVACFCCHYASMRCEALSFVHFVLLATCLPVCLRPFVFNRSVIHSIADFATSITRTSTGAVSGTQATTYG